MFFCLFSLYLPFSCQSIEQLVQFAYHGQCNLHNDNYQQLTSIAQMTSSFRLMKYLQDFNLENK